MNAPATEIEPSQQLESVTEQPAKSPRLSLSTANNALEDWEIAFRKWLAHEIPTTEAERVLAKILESPSFPGSGEVPFAWAKRRLQEEGYLDLSPSGIKGYLHRFMDDWMPPMLRVLLRYSGLAGWGKRQALDLRLNTLPVKVRHWPQELNGFRILHLSDMHIDPFPELAEKLADLLRPIECDLCLLTGDFRFAIDGDSEQVLPQVDRWLPEIRSRYGVYGILGNHDESALLAPLAERGIRWLLNEGTEIKTEKGANFWLLGVDDVNHYHAADLERAQQQIPNDACQVLMAHSPDLVDEAAQADIDLYLCGHTHGGQFCLPGGTPLLVNSDCEKKCIKGSWSQGEMQGYTSVGIGCSAVQARFFCSPEVTLFELTSAS
ncbi:Metallophosphoesterase [Planctomycetales bacterium 10988]|nr:Metallophosphoesterase [Planctomycetales bacterium 10988]